MATVSDVTIKYAAQGAKAAQKADKGVRDSIKETAKTARKESGTISRWMQRHRNALIGIGAASAAAMGAIIKNSPALQAELSTVRLGFSLLAMQIGNDLAPALRGAGDLALDASEAYSDLPDPIRKVTSGIIGLGLVIGSFLGVLAGLQSLIEGTFVATLGKKAAGAISGFISGTIALAVAVGIIIALLVVWVLHITGVLDRFKDLGKGLSDFLSGPLAGFKDALIAVITFAMGPLLVLGAAIVGFVEGGFSGAMERAGEMITIMVTGVKNTINNVIGYLRGTAAGMLSGAIDYVIGGIQDTWRGFKQWLIGGSFIPDLINDVVSYLRSSGESLLRDAFDTAIGAAEDAINALNPRQWGIDMMRELENGIESAADSVRETAEGIQEDISEHIGFDNVSNDRMARRWGSDLVQEFESGMKGERTNLRRSARGARSQLGEMSATPSGVGGGGGGSPTVEVRFERGAIRQRGNGEVEVNQRSVTKEQGSAFDSRSNI